MNIFKSFVNKGGNKLEQVRPDFDKSKSGLRTKL